MGDPTEGHAYAETRREMSVEHLEDVARIAESVRSVAGADGALVSRVLDEDWLEIVAVVGTVPAADPDALPGMRWHREHLEHSLDEAERLGHVHLTPGRGLQYVALTAGDPA